MSDTRLYGLPSPTPTQFNTAAEKIAGKGALVWTDTNADKKLDASELSGSKAAQYVAQKTFTPGFERLYRDLVEQVRQESVARELSFTYMQPLVTDIDKALRAFPKSYKITETEIALYKRGIAKLLEVAPHMQEAFQAQAGYTEDMKKSPKTALDQELINRYGHPWCSGDSSAICSALPSLAAHESGVIASGITCKELGEDLMGPYGPFTVVTREKDGTLKTTPFSVAFAKYHEPAAAKLKEAAQIFSKIPREKSLANYLAQLADDFANPSPFPYNKSNTLWVAQKSTNSLLFVRIGPDENGNLGIAIDNCESKAKYHFAIGLKNPDFAVLSEKYMPFLSDWEKEFAELIGDPKLYTPQQVVVKPPDLVDIIYSNGDDTGGASGTSAGQTLPNWCGEDGKEEPCHRRTMIFGNKMLKSYSPDVLEKYIAPIFHASVQPILNAGKLNFESVTLHELAHNLGPQQGKPKPGTDTDFASPHGKWKGMIEEFKAQNWSLYFRRKELLAARADAKAGKLTEAQLHAAEDVYKSESMKILVWALRHVMRATRTGTFDVSQSTAYSKLAACTLGTLVEEGALTFDDKTKTWLPDFEKISDASKTLTQKVLQLYAKGDFEKTNAFVSYWLTGDGFKQLHTDRLQEVSGKAPSAIYEYQIKGLGKVRKN